MCIRDRFIDIYPFIHRVETIVEESIWSRMTPDGVPHNHAFSRGSGTEINTASAMVARNGLVEIESGIKNVSLLKTTKSSWANFHRDEHRTLPDVHERMLATELTVRWKYAQLPSVSEYRGLRTRLRQALIEQFAGPASTGVFSAGVQSTLYNMGKAALEVSPTVTWMHLNAPNIHFIPAPALAAVGKYKFEDDVFMPTDEPRGLIQLVLTQPAPSKL
eukprot:TRINITY_DN28065_c0_g1_i1.p1 TRINITY_DN28065_c0_g1~~TRINITY_DN28065_c0_g1_i1.p1  ORF type:complete len:218 (-),score=45.98 TRINITY_DN28065_c0_g1_i1:98-751(-)